MTYCRVYCVSSLLLGCTTLSKVMDGGSASLTLKGRATGAPSEGEGTPGVHGFLIKAPLTWCLAVQTMPPDGLAHPQILGDGMAGGQGPSVIPSPGGQSSFSGRTFTWSHPGVSHNTTRSRVLSVIHVLRQTQLHIVLPGPYSNREDGKKYGEAVLTPGQQQRECHVSVKSAASQSKGINHWWVDRGSQPQERKMQQMTLSGALSISQRKQLTRYMYLWKLLSPVWLLAIPGTAAHRNSPGKNTGVGCHFLLQEIFPTQGQNLCFLHCQVDSLLSEPQGSLCVFVPIMNFLK